MSTHYQPTPHSIIMGVSNDRKYAVLKSMYEQRLKMLASTVARTLESSSSYKGDPVSLSSSSIGAIGASGESLSSSRIAQIIDDALTIERNGEVERLRQLMAEQAQQIYELQQQQQQHHHQQQHQQHKSTPESMDDSFRGGIASSVSSSTALPLSLQREHDRLMLIRERDELTRAVANSLSAANSANASREHARHIAEARERELADVRASFEAAKASHSREVSELRASFADLKSAQAKIEADVRENDELKALVSTLRAEISNTLAQKTALEKKLSDVTSEVSTLREKEIASKKVEASSEEKSVLIEQLSKRIVDLESSLKMSRKTTDEWFNKAKITSHQAASLNDRLLHSQRKIESANASTAVYNARIASLEEEIVSIRAEAEEAAENSRTLLNNSETNRANEVALLKRAIEDLKADLTEQSETTAKAVQDAAEYAKHISQLVSERTQLSRALDESRSAQRTASSEMNISLQKEANYSGENARLNSMVESLKAHVETLEREAKRLRAENESTLESKKKEFESIVATSEAASSSVKELLQKKIVDLESEKEAFMKKLFQLEGELAFSENFSSQEQQARLRSESRISFLEAELDTSRRMIDELSDYGKAVLTECEDLRISGKASASELQRLREELGLKESLLQEEQGKCAELTSKFSTLEQRFSNLQQTWSVLGTEHNKELEKRAKLQKDKDELISHIDVLEAEAQNMTTILEEKDSTISDLIAEVEELSTEVKNASTKMLEYKSQSETLEYMQHDFETREEESKKENDWLRAQNKSQLEGWMTDQKNFESRVAEYKAEIENLTSDLEAESKMTAAARKQLEADAEAMSALRESADSISRNLRAEHEQRLAFVQAQWRSENETLRKDTEMLSERFDRISALYSETRKELEIAQGHAAAALQRVAREQEAAASSNEDAQQHITSLTNEKTEVQAALQKAVYLLVELRSASTKNTKQVVTLVESVSRSCMDVLKKIESNDSALFTYFDSYKACVSSFIFHETQDPDATTNVSAENFSLAPLESLVREGISIDENAQSYLRNLLQIVHPSLDILASHLTSIKTETEASSNTISDLSLRLQTLKSESEKVMKEQKDQSFANNVLKSEVETSKEQLKAAEKTLLELQSVIKNSVPKAEADELSNRLNAADDEIVKLKDQLKSSESSRQDVHSLWSLESAAHEKQRERVSALTSELASVRELLAQCETDRDSFKSKYEKCDAEKLKLELRVMAQKYAEKESETDSSSFKARIAQLELVEVEANNLRTDLFRLTNELESAKRELSKNSNANREHIEENAARIQSMTQEIGDLKSQLEETLNRALLAEDKVKELQLEITSENQKRNEFIKMMMKKAEAKHQEAFEEAEKLANSAVAAAERQASEGMERLKEEFARTMEEHSAKIALQNESSRAEMQAKLASYQDEVNVLKKSLEETKEEGERLASFERSRAEKAREKTKLISSELQKLAKEADDALNQAQERSTELAAALELTCVALRISERRWDASSRVGEEGRLLDVVQRAPDPANVKDEESAKYLAESDVERLRSVLEKSLTAGFQDRSISANSDGASSSSSSSTTTGRLFDLTDKLGQLAKSTSVSQQGSRRASLSL